MGFSLSDIYNAGKKVYSVGSDIVGGTLGNVYHGAGMGDAPNRWEGAQEDLDAVRAKGGDVYTQAMADAAAARAGVPSGAVAAPDAIRAQTIAAPSAIRAQTLATPDAIRAQSIATPGLVGGQEAEDLRTRQLSQAETAANSPSAAAAQMRAAGAQISRQQLGVAAGARGADRLAAKRDAMVAIGNRGNEAAATSGALAASEQAAKQQAYTNALAGVRAGDVNTTAAQTDIARANQSADLTSQQQNAANAIQVGTTNQTADLNQQQQNVANSMQQQQLNQAADLTAQTQNAGNQLTAAQATAGNSINAYSAGNAASNAYLNTALGGGNLQNQSNAVQSNYATGQNTLQQNQNQTAAKVVGSALSIPGLKDVGGGSSGGSGANTGAAAGGSGAMNLVSGLFKGSDERMKSDISPVGDYSRKLSAAYGLGSEAGSPYSGVTTVQLDSAPQPSLGSKGNDGGHYGEVLSSLLGSGTGGGMLAALSDEATKEQVDRMSDAALVKWAKKPGLFTYYYQDGFEDSGEQPHLGTTAQSLEKTGPIGKMLVRTRPDGMKEVDYGGLAYATAKAALIAAEGKKGASHGRR